MNKCELILSLKNVYGRDLYYPACDVSRKIASISGVKTFTLNQVKSLKEVFIVSFTVGLNSNH